MPFPFLASSLALAAAVALLGCAAAPAHTVPGSGRLVHAVAFWLKPDAPADVVDRMRAFYLERVTTGVPGVASVWVGRPRPATRSVVDASFACKSVVRFESAAAEAGWQSHPVHAEFKQRFEPHLERVVVYDFVE